MGADEVPLSDLIVVFACCGGVSANLCSLYLKCPECLGCYENSTCCCVEYEGECCKKTDEESGGDPGDCCVIQKTECKLISPRVCCLSVSQCCCIDCRTANPPTGSDILMACALFGLVCYPQFGCCANAGELKDPDGVAAEGAPAAPDAVIVMSRTNDARVVKAIEPQAAMSRDA